MGDVVPLDQIEAALKARQYKALIVTPRRHVDRGHDRRQSHRRRWRANTAPLSIVDGVCATAAEECRQEEWGIDVYLTASQKAVGTPPGLALLVAGPRAIAAFKARRTPPASYYADFAQWLPVMEAYEARKPAYYGTSGG